MISLTYIISIQTLKLWGVNDAQNRSEEHKRRALNQRKPRSKRSMQQSSDSTHTKSTVETTFAMSSYKSTQKMEMKLN